MLPKEKDKKGKARKFRIGEHFILPVDGSEVMTAHYNKKLKVYEAARFDVSQPLLAQQPSR